MITLNKSKSKYAWEKMINNDVCTKLLVTRQVGIDDYCAVNNKWITMTWDIRQMRSMIRNNSYDNIE